MAETFRVHDVAHVLKGKYQGLVGTVTDTRQNAGKQTGVRVMVEGVRDSQPVKGHVWLRLSEVGRNG